MINKVIKLLKNDIAETIFKKALIEKKEAYVRLYKIDGTFELKYWNASKFNEFSTLRNNINSGYLRGWKDRGIYKAEFAIEKSDLD